MLSVTQTLLQRHQENPLQSDGFLLQLVQSPNSNFLLTLLVSPLQAVLMSSALKAKLKKNVLSSSHLPALVESNRMS